MFQIVKEPNKLVPSIPEATDGKTIPLIVAEPVGTATGIDQVAGPGIRSRRLRRAPPVAEVANTAEATIVEVAVAARKT